MNLISKINSYTFISFLALAVFVSISHLGLLQEISIRNVAAITFLLLVIYTAFKNTFFHGFISALVAETYFLYIYATPGQPFHYTEENIWRLIIIGGTLFALAYLMAAIRQQMTTSITVEKNAREKAEKIAQTLKKSDHQKEEFISIASHELKTPITSLKLFTHLLKKKTEAEGDNQTQLYIEKIDNQVNSLTNLTTNLLDASRISTGKLALRKEQFSINNLIKEKIDEIASINNTYTIIKKGSTTKKFLGDKHYISQVIINLLNNAVRYSPDGSTIIVKVEEKAKEMLISVQDFGSGIAKEHQKKIFEQFYQISGHKSNRGLGIGLYISSQIIKQHGGKISVQSQPGEGATFTVSLPLTPPNKLN